MYLMFNGVQHLDLKVKILFIFSVGELVLNDNL